MKSYNGMLSLLNEESYFSSRVDSFNVIHRIADRCYSFSSHRVILCRDRFYPTPLQTCALVRRHFVYSPRQLVVSSSLLRLMAFHRALDRSIVRTVYTIFQPPQDRLAIQYHGLTFSPYRDADRRPMVAENLIGRFNRLHFGDVNSRPIKHNHFIEK